MIYSPYESWIAITLACIATLFWRFLGILLVEKINTNGIIMQWINSVAYSMVAASFLILRNGYRIQHFVFQFNTPVLAFDIP